jgi:hypothetical protein
MKPNFGREVIVEENYWPASLLSALERGESIGGKPKRDVAKITEEFIGHLLAVDGDKPVTQDAIIGSIENILHFCVRLVFPAVRHLFDGRGIFKVRDESGDEGNICEGLSRSAVGLKARFIAIGTFLLICMGSDVAAA